MNDCPLSQWIVVTQALPLCLNPKPLPLLLEACVITAWFMLGLNWTLAYPSSGQNRHSELFKSCGRPRLGYLVGGSCYNSDSAVYVSLPTSLCHNNEGKKHLNYVVFSSKNLPIFNPKGTLFPYYDTVASGQQESHSTVRNSEEELNKGVSLPQRSLWLCMFTNKQRYFCSAAERLLRMLTVHVGSDEDLK